MPRDWRGEMDVRITPKKLSGTVTPPPSKSQAHRLLICAALGRAPVEIRCQGISKDIAATIAANEGCSMYEIISRARAYPELQRSAGKLDQFLTLIQTLQQKASTLELAAAPAHSSGAP